MDETTGSVSFSDLSLSQFLERLSSADAVPGGGAAAAVAAALGASLISMVAALSTGRPKYAAYADTHAKCGAVGRELAVEFFTVSKSYSMPGWRVGFCVGNRTLVGARGTIKGYLDYGMFGPVQLAAATALSPCRRRASIDPAS